MNKDIDKRVFGLSLLGFGFFLGKETFIYAWGKILDFAIRENLFFNFKNELDLQKTSSLVIIVIGIILIILSNKKNELHVMLYLEAWNRKNGIEILRSKNSIINRAEFLQSSEEEFHKSKAFLDLMKKFGFQTPILDADLHASLIIIQKYIIQIIPYLSKELISEGKRNSEKISKQATQISEKFKFSDWFYE